jgi:hypothetical protein
MVFSVVRNYFHELHTLVPTEWKFFQKYGSTVPDPSSDSPDHDLRRLQTGYRQRDIEAQLLSDYHDNYESRLTGRIERLSRSSEPFEFYQTRPDPISPDRISHPGIQTLPYQFHSFGSSESQEALQLSEERYILPPLKFLLDVRYPQFLPAVNAFTRPTETVSRTFEDFNKEQIEYPPVPPDLARRIVTLITFLLNAKPFRPLHWIDTFFIKLPLATGASYFHRYSHDQNIHARYSHPSEYESKTTSNGYFFNSFSEYSRTIVHHIKEFALPFDPTNLSPSQILEHSQRFILSHATMLFTRSQISKILGPFKVRPVYAVDRLFIHLEAMITHPLHLLGRSLDSSLMYSIETIRGGCSYVDLLARNFSSYLCLDWSSYDQRVPWTIVETFFTLFLPSLIIINDGYAPTSEYPSYPGLSPDMLASRIFNILTFLRIWYYNMVFVLASGHSYVRKFCGIASGMLNTQYLDSYCNLFIMIHALFHFGCTDSEILEICFLVMGDDNVLLTDWSIVRLQEFLDFIVEHALSRFGMVVSPQKTIITRIRTRIEMLGYITNGGLPLRLIDKLVAQLVFPEHGPKLRTMSSRAIGMAWAAAGSSPMFHRFCYDVYLTFLPYQESSSDASNARHALPGYLAFVSYYGIDPEISFSTFPSINAVRDKFQHIQGVLPYAHKWSPAHFLVDPDFLPENAITLEMYMSRNDMSFPDVPRLFE